MSDPNDEICNLSSNEHFADMLACSQKAVVSRRQLICGVWVSRRESTLPLVAACGGCDDPQPVTPRPPNSPAVAALGFSAVGKSLLDDVIAARRLHRRRAACNR